jgi:adenylate cyclase
VGTRTGDIRKAVSDVLLGRLEHRGTEVPALAGVTADHARRFWQALGFPSAAVDEEQFTHRDVEALRFTASLIDGVGPDREMLLQMTRATGQALSRVAHMHVLSIADAVAEVTRSRSFSNNEAADEIATLAESLVRGYEPFLGYIWRRHLFAAISQIVAGAAGQIGEAEPTTVGFADLVGFTALTQQMGDQRIAEVVDHFEKISYREIPERGGRIVKTLGDEVMFANVNVHAAADTALAIAAACKDDPVLPDVRVGVAVGSMLAWEGDFYGPTVNLASRLAGIATPGTVIVSDELAERLSGDEAFRLIEIRDVKLKGIGRTKPWVLRRGGEELPRRR